MAQLPLVLVYHGSLLFATELGSGYSHLLSLRCIGKINHPLQYAQKWPANQQFSGVPFATVSLKQPQVSPTKPASRTVEDRRYQGIGFDPGRWKPTNVPRKLDENKSKGNQMSQQKKRPNTFHLNPGCLMKGSLYPENPKPFPRVFCFQGFGCPILRISQDSSGFLGLNPGCFMKGSEIFMVYEIIPAKEVGPKDLRRFSMMRMPNGGGLMAVNPMGSQSVNTSARNKKKTSGQKLPRKSGWSNSLLWRCLPATYTWNSKQAVFFVECLVTQPFPM